jgi:hypothetical protein
MGGVVEDVANGIGGFVDDITGKTARNEKATAASTQANAVSKANTSYGTGSGMVGKADDYWSNWLTNPSAAYKSTLDQASNIGGALAEQATNNAVNTARGSGLNAGQAALAGGAQSSNAFTTGTLGAQDQLLNQGNTSAEGEANTGSNLMASGLGALSGVSAQQQQQAQTDVGRTDKAQAGVVSALTSKV